MSCCLPQAHIGNHQVCVIAGRQIQVRLSGSAGTTAASASSTLHPVERRNRAWEMGWWSAELGNSSLSMEGNLG